MYANLNCRRFWHRKFFYSYRKIFKKVKKAIKGQVIYYSFDITQKVAFIQNVTSLLKWQNFKIQDHENNSACLFVGRNDECINTFWAKASFTWYILKNLCKTQFGSKNYAVFTLCGFQLIVMPFFHFSKEIGDILPQLIT